MIRQNKGKKPTRVCTICGKDKIIWFHRINKHHDEKDMEKMDYSKTLNSIYLLYINGK